MSEGRDHFTRLLAHQNIEMPTSSASLTRRAWALEIVGEYCMFQGDLDAAQPSLEESLELFRKIEDDAGIAEVLSDHGLLFERRGDYERATAFFQESLRLFRELGKQDSIMLILFFLGAIALA